MANRIKDALPNILGQEETGLIPGQFIGDSSRLTYDLIQYLKRTKKVALFLSFDIQDAFNSFAWDFVRIILKKNKIAWIPLFDGLIHFTPGAVSRIVCNSRFHEGFLFSEKILKRFS